MSQKTAEKGHCLCGAVRLSAATMSHDIGACHCTMCRKWGGGPLLALDCGSDVTFEGSDNIGVYPSSEWAERGFCQKCGSHLFYRLKQNGQYFIPVGLFDLSDTLTFDHQVFIEEKPNYYSFANETATMTGEELFAQFAPSAE